MAVSAAIVAGAILVARDGSGSSDVERVAPTTASRAVPTTQPAPTTAPRVTELPRRAVLIGDSIASTIASALESTGAARGIAIESMARVGCGLTSGVVQQTMDAAVSARCAVETPGYLDDVSRRLTAGDAVLWFSSWEVNDHAVDGRVLTFRSPEWDAWFLGELEAARRRFVDRGAILVLVTVAPRAPVNGVDRQPLAYAIDTTRLTEVYGEFARRHPEDVIVADLAAAVCPTAPSCPEQVDGVVARPDSTHYGDAGARWAAGRVLDLMAAALAD